MRDLKSGEAILECLKAVGSTLDDLTELLEDITGRVEELERRAQGLRIDSEGDEGLVEFRVRVNRDWLGRDEGEEAAVRGLRLSMLAARRKLEGGDDGEN